MTEEQKILFRQDPFITHVIEKGAKITLCGGAVLDILEGRSVKDYDTIYLYSADIDRLGLHYQYDTKTATTYFLANFTVQVLKRSKEDFDFKISQSTLQVSHKGEMSLSLHEDSFKSKSLIPPEVAWNNIGLARNSLSRINHWKKKGYTIHEKTYKSLRKAAKMSLIDKLISYFTNSEES